MNTTNQLIVEKHHLIPDWIFDYFVMIALPVLFFVSVRAILIYLEDWSKKK